MSVILAEIWIAYKFRLITSAVVDVPTAGATHPNTFTFMELIALIPRQI